MTILAQAEHGVATITINRPDRLNALDRGTRHDLLDALRDAASNTSVGAVVLTGAGRAFCVGQDLGATDELVRADETVAGTYNLIAETLAGMPKPVVAAVNGLAVGAGFGLVLGCDLRVASPTATFACAFGKVALVPDTGVSWHLVRDLGYARAFSLATTGRSIPADEALTMGLLNEVIDAEDLLTRATQIATELATGPRPALALTKKIFRMVPDAAFTAVLAAEAVNQGIAARHPDHLEGRTAFVEKRAPRWT